MMKCEGSPLENLAAFALAFGAGIIATVCLTQYIQHIKAVSGLQQPSEG